MRRCTIAAGEHPRAAALDGRRTASRGTGFATRMLAVRGVTLMILAFVLAARAAQAAPGVLVAIGDRSPLGLPFSRFSDVALDDRGRVAFVGASVALFGRGGGTLGHLVGAGDTVLGQALAGVDGPALGGSGCLAFRALFAGGGSAIVERCGAVDAAIARVGEPAPGGGRFAGFGSDVALGGGGRLAFSAVLDDGAQGVFAVDADATSREVARTGGVSPAGGTFTGLRVIGVVGAATVAFRGVVSSGPVGLFTWDGSALHGLAVTGDASPAGGAFTTVGFGTLNDTGVCAFRASISIGPRGGIFRAVVSPSPVAVSTVALEDDASPIGGTFKSFPTSLVPWINAGGDIAFRATLAGDGVPSASVFVSAAAGPITKVVAAGEPTAAGELVRLREVELADDGGVLVRASLAGGAPGLFRVRGGRVDPFAVLGDATDLGAGFRFADATVRGSLDEAVFLGLLEGLFVADGPGRVRRVAVLGQPGARGGKFAGFDPPAGGGRSLAFGATLEGGRSGEILFAVGGQGAQPRVHSGQRVGRKGRVVDLFSSPLDDLAHASLSGGCVAFQTALSGVGGATGIVVLGGDGLRIVARAGQRAPGGGAYREFGTPAAGGGCQVVFVARTGEGETPSLYRAGGGASRRVAAGEDETRTHLGGIFRGFDTPAASGNRVAFHATLDQGREGVFFARGRCLMAMAGTGEGEPGGGKWKSFGAPAFAGPDVVFRASVLGGSAPGGVYRAMPSGSCTQVPPPVATLIAVGMPATPAGPFLGFGTPSGNRHGAVAVSADLTGGGATDAVVLMTN